MYHAVGTPGKYGNVSVNRLRRDMQYLTDHFEVVDLPAVLGPGGGKRVALTFDDAYLDFYENALPVLREFDVPATLYAPVAFVDGGPHELSYRFFHSPSEFDQFNYPSRGLEAEHDLEMMSWDQLSAVADDELITVGNHTMTHPDLASIAEKERLNEEIRGAREQLTEQLNISIDRFCFPYGRYSNEALDVVTQTHQSAVTSKPGVLLEATEYNAHLLPRIRAHEPEHLVRWKLSGIPSQLVD